MDGDLFTFSMVSMRGALARWLCLEEEEEEEEEVVVVGGGGVFWFSRLDMISPKASLLEVG